MQNLLRTRSLVLILLGAQGLLAGCKYSAPPNSYTHVSTVTVTEAEISEPFGIAVNDDLTYFSDGAAGAIRAISSDGATTIVTSGLNTPSAICLHPNGDLIVADTGSHTIRKVSEDGSTVILGGVEGVSGAGDGPVATATFNGPIGLVVRGNGDIYVSDTYNDRIRLIRDGVVSTVAGSDRGFADGAATAAKFDTPLGIAAWGDKLLVADSGNGRIRIVEPDNTVSTLAGSDQRDLLDGQLADALFTRPTAVAVDGFGRILVADGNAIRVIGGRLFPAVETIAGNQRGFADGMAVESRFNRPSGLGFGINGELYVADSDNGAVRVLTHRSLTSPDNPRVDQIQRHDSGGLLASRWPYDPATNPREIAGTLGEIRGEIGPNNKPSWFHNGLDIAGAYGETARFLRDEFALDPHSVENFGTSRELLRMPLLGYIHLRLGRDKENRILGDPRFQFERSSGGELTGLRIRRGTRFAAGDVLGTLNAMNHVHLITGRSGQERNALSAIAFPGIRDSIAPVIENVDLFTSDWRRLDGDSPIALSGPSRIIVRAYDRMDGNSERRRLGVYRLGYQLLANGYPHTDIEWTITFDSTPANDAVRLAYAQGSQSGYSGVTIFNYIVSNRIRGELSHEDFLDISSLSPGRYTLRVFATDFFGNTASKDVEIQR